MPFLLEEHAKLVEFIHLAALEMNFETADKRPGLSPQSALEASLAKGLIKAADMKVAKGIKTREDKENTKSA